jgi:Tfp pilus assembly protein PilO
MIQAESEERRSGLKGIIIEQLHDPIKLRIVVVAVVLLAGYIGVYSPLSEKIHDKTKRIKRDTELLELAERVEGLQKQYSVVADRIPLQTDSKDWLQFMIEEMRGFSLRMSTLNCPDPVQIGPYKVFTIKMDLEGSFVELDRFLRWVETNKRILRIDEITLGGYNEGRSNMKVTLLGIST